MSVRESHDGRTIKPKRPAVPPALNPGPSGPTRFFLRSEADMERNSPRGRRAARKSLDPGQSVVEDAPRSCVEVSNYGVESLAETIAAAEGSFQHELSRSDTSMSDDNVDLGANESGSLPRRQPRDRNPVHPAIRAAGRRILSNDHRSGQAPPRSIRSAESPYRLSPHRRGSAASSINMTSEPMTPLKMSPHPESALPSTPWSGSPKSFRLSDEEASMADETGSQAVESSNEDDDVTEESKTSSMPQLVMPSIAMPVRRPFTQQGKRTGRLKVLVIGAAGIGKTSLVNNILRVSEDVVHVDALKCSSVHGYGDFTELYASTKPIPSWRSDFENKRALQRRKSIGEGVLERNICFIDSPALNADNDSDHISEYFDASQHRAARHDQLPDSELVAMLSGDGGVQIDAVLWLLTPDGLHLVPGPLLQKLCQQSNVIPVLARSDCLAADQIAAGKRDIKAKFEELASQPYSFSFPVGQGESLHTAQENMEPLAVSSATTEDADEFDASILMSSQYMAPLVPSELAHLVEHLLDPDNIARMRHLSATKLLLWRQQHQIDSKKQMVLHSPPFGATLQSALPSVTSTGSLLEDPSKILVPHSTSSFYRSGSPSASASSALSSTGQQASTRALDHDPERSADEAPFRQIRLAKWARDLQRSLRNESRRYKDMYTRPPPEWNNSTITASDDEKALAVTRGRRRPARGRLGGDIAIIDPRDPLGVLAFSQSLRLRGLFALQIAGGMGLVGAVAWWVTRNWGEVQELFGFPGQIVVSQPAVPAPERGLFEEFEDVLGRAFAGLLERGMVNGRRMWDVLSG